jgi:hypothetical protein
MPLIAGSSRLESLRDRPPISAAGSQATSRGPAYRSIASARMRVSELVGPNDGRLPADRRRPRSAALASLSSHAIEWHPAATPQLPEGRNSVTRHLSIATGSVMTARARPVRVPVGRARRFPFRRGAAGDRMPASFNER